MNLFERKRYAMPAIRVTVGNSPRTPSAVRLVGCAASYGGKGRVDDSTAPGAGFAPITVGTRPVLDPLDRLAYLKHVGVIVRQPSVWRKA